MSLVANFSNRSAMSPLLSSVECPRDMAEMVVVSDVVRFELMGTRLLGRFHPFRSQHLNEMVLWYTRVEINTGLVNGNRTKVG